MQDDFHEKNHSYKPITTLMKKFAFIVHLRKSYRQDLKLLSRPLGFIPDSFYRFALRNRPIPPILGCDVTITRGATKPEGHIILLPYSAGQLLEQRELMLPRLEQAAKLAADNGAEIMGLGALTSPITLGGKLLQNNPHVRITNGNAYTAVIAWKRVSRLISNSNANRPVVALVGASGSVGSLVCKLLAKNNMDASYMLVARNKDKLYRLASEMKSINYKTETTVSNNIDDVKRADIIVLLTSAADCILHSTHLKQEAIVLDVTQPRNTSASLLTERPDVTIIDGGLVSIPALHFTKSLGLPKGIAFACMAETMLLAQAGYNGNFSIGNPTLEQAELISDIAQQYAHLGFDLAPDHSFGKPVNKVVPVDFINNQPLLLASNN
jgi:fatty aldehyde-generating acyl-ACP reductase